MITLGRTRATRRWLWKEQALSRGPANNSKPPPAIHMPFLNFAATSDPLVDFPVVLRVSIMQGSGPETRVIAFLLAMLTCYSHHESLIRSALQIVWQLAAVSCKFRHDLFVKPNIHRGGIASIAIVVELRCEFLTRSEAAVYG
jgi:hypothetical protein